MTEEGGDATGNVVEVEFRIDDPSYPFVAASHAESCTIDLADVVPRSDGRMTEYYTVDGGSVERLYERARERPGVEAAIVSEHEDGGLLKVVLDTQCVTVTIADAGAIPRRVRADSGTGTVVAVAPMSSIATDVIDRFDREHPEAKLVARRVRDYETPVLTRRELQRLLDDRLTDRQREVLATAYRAGFFEWPRETDGDELAEALGIASPTFFEILRAAQSNVLSLYFDPDDDAERP